MDENINNELENNNENKEESNNLNPTPQMPDNNFMPPAPSAEIPSFGAPRIDLSLVNQNSYKKFANPKNNFLTE